MPTCKDCIHYEACQGIINAFAYEVGRGLDYNVIERVETDSVHCEDAEECNNFKDRSKFIELPCKVGDYLFESAFGQITEFEVIGFEFASFRPEYIYIEIENKVNRFVTGTFAFNIGKTVFLTKEEAERALEGI